MSTELVLLAVVLVGAWVGSRFMHRQRREEAERLGHALDLRVHDNGTDIDLHGARLGIGVSIRFTTRGYGKNAKEITVLRAEGVPPTVSFAAQTFGATTLRRLTGGEDLLTGDPVFDPAVLVRGPDAWIAATLDAPTRRAIRTFLVEDGAIREGSVTIALSGHVTDVRVLQSMLDRVADLAVRLGHHDDLLPRLSRIALEDPEPDARMVALRALGRADRLVAAGIARRLCEAPDPDLRLVARLTADDEEGLLQEPLDLLRRVDPVDADALCKALARAGAVSSLVALLDGADPARTIAAARGLSRVGRVADVAALRAAQGSAHGDAYDALERAVASIQARVEGAGRGQVSLAEEPGRVDLAAQAGALDLPKH